MAQDTKKTEDFTTTGIFESFTKIGESLFNMDVRKAAGAYIDFIENLTKQSLDLQDALTGWAKDTPLAPVFEFQTSISRKLAEASITAARNLWQVQAAGEGR